MMDFITLSWIDYVLFCVVFGGSCMFGIYFGCFGNRQETRNEYLLGGRNMGVVSVAVSLIASTFSAPSLLGTPTEVYFYGTQYWMMWLSVLIAGLCTNYIFLPVYFKLGVTTLYEYLELRFSVHVRRMISFIYVLDCLTTMPCFVYAPALALNQMSGFNLHLTAIALTVVCIFYTSLGGLRGVVWSSTLQFCVTLSTLCAVIAMGAVTIGGWSTIWDRNIKGERIEIFNVNPDPTVRATLWSVVIGNIFIWTNYTATSTATIQRLLSLPRLRDAKRASFAYTFGTIFAKSLCCFAGLILFAKYYECDPLSAGFIQRPDQILPYYVLDVATKFPGISGLFVAAIFSTTLSSLSTSINSLSGTIYVDLIEKFMPTGTTERTASNTIRGIAILLGIITIGLVFVVEKLGTILQLFVSFSGIVAGPTVGVYVLGMLFPISNTKGALYGAGTAIVSVWCLAIGRYVNDVDSTAGYLPKPFYEHSCNSTSILDTTSATYIADRSEPLWIFKISFYYYGFIGVTITLIVGLLVSWLTKNSENNKTNLNVLSPLSRCFVKKSEGEATTRETFSEKFENSTERIIK